jgi:hypothetical protein
MSEKQDLGLGKIIKGEAFRDAIHIAVAPVIAHDSPLHAGDRIGLVDGKAVHEKNCDEAIGVVDPYLRKPVLRGQKFWLLLFPNTIEGLRHEWRHPAFPNVDPEVVLDAMDGKAKRTLVEIATQIGTDYDDLVSGLTAHVDTGDYIHRGDNESYNDLSKERLEEMWAAWQDVTGKKAPVDKFGSGPFSCSC